MPRTINRKTLKCWVGLWNRIEHFIPNYSYIVEQIYNILKKNNKWKQTQSKKEALVNSNSALISTPAIYMVTGASFIGVAGYVAQGKFEDQEIIQHISRYLKEAERKY